MNKTATILTRPDQTRPDQTRPDQCFARNSSLELLRIFAMLMIVSYHFVHHGGFDFPSNAITFNRIYYEFMKIFGSLGNNIFVLISGYFLIESDGVKFLKLFNLWLRIFFYSVVCYCILALSGFEAFSLTVLVKNMMPISQRLYWFPTTYIIMYALHGWLNIFLKNLSREDYISFLLTCVTLWTILPAVLPSNFEGNPLTSFIVLYSLAGYIKLWCKDLGSKKFILYGVLLAAVNFLSAVLFCVIGLKIKYFALNCEHFYGMLMPFTLGACLCFLIGFRSLNLHHNSTINITASASFGVYLIHDNDFVRQFLWHEVFCNSSFQDSTYLIPYSIAAVLAVYVSCTFIELLRSKIFTLISRGRLS